MKPLAKLAIVVSAIDKATKPIQKIGRTINRTVGGRMKGIVKAAQKVNNAFQKIRFNAALGRSITRMKTAIKGLSVVAIATAGSIAAIWSRTSNDGDRIAKTARALGLTAEAYQELEFAADRSGAAQDQFQSGFKDFVKKLGEMRNGTGELYSVLEKHGPQTLAALKAAESNEQALQIMLRSVAATKNEANRAMIADKAFGGGASTGFINLALAGEAEIAKLRTQARENGILSEAQAEAAEKAVDAITNLKAAISGIVKLSSAVISPRLTEFVEGLARVIRESRPAILAYVERLAGMIPTTEEFVKGLGRLADKFKGIIDSVRPVINFLGGPVNTILTGIAAIVAGPMVTAVGALSLAVLGVGKAFGKIAVIMLANPIGATIAALAGGAWLIQRNWSNISGFFSERFRNIRAAFKRDWLGGVQKSLEAFDPINIFIDALGGVAKWFATNALGIKGAGKWVDRITTAMKEFNPLAVIRKAIFGVVNYFRTVDLGKSAALMWKTMTAPLRAVIATIQQMVEGIGGKLHGITADIKNSLGIGPAPDQTPAPRSRSMSPRQVGNVASNLDYIFGGRPAVAAPAPAEKMEGSVDVKVLVEDDRIKTIVRKKGVLLRDPPNTFPSAMRPVQILPQQ